VININKETLSVQELKTLKDKHYLLTLKVCFANIFILLLVTVFNAFLVYVLEFLRLNEAVAISSLFTFIIMFLYLRSIYKINKDFSIYDGDFNYELYEMFGRNVKNYIKKIDAQDRKMLNIELKAIVEYSTMHRNISYDNYL
jgi:hypothetical protein